MKRNIFIVIMCILIITGCSNNSDEIKLLHGELLDFKESCNEYDDNDTSKCLKTVAVIKAKIEPSYSNKATIDQNYYNVEDFIKNSNGTKYDEISYWAVADMESGNESKVVSFTINKDLINKIKDGKIVANQLGNYVDDLWILPSLK